MPRRVKRDLEEQKLLDQVLNWTPENLRSGGERSASSLEHCGRLLLLLIMEHLNIPGTTGQRCPRDLHGTVMRWFVTLPQSQQERLATQIADSYTRQASLGMRS